MTEKTTKKIATQTTKLAKTAKKNAKSATKSANSRKTKAAATSSKPSPAKTSKSAREPVAKRFRVTLERYNHGEACGFNVPFDVFETFGTRARVPVRGTINGHPFRTTIMPMRGRHMMVVNREMREGSGVRGGDTVTVVMERDTEERTVAPPEDLARALKANGEARAAWDALSYTHKKEYARSIEEAVRPETRQRRIEKTLAALAASKPKR